MLWGSVGHGNVVAYQFDRALYHTSNQYNGVGFGLPCTMGHGWGAGGHDFASAKTANGRKSLTAGNVYGNDSLSTYRGGLRHALHPNRYLVNVGLTVTGLPIRGAARPRDCATLDVMRLSHVCPTIISCSVTLIHSVLRHLNGLLGECPRNLLHSGRGLDLLHVTVSIVLRYLGSVWSANLYPLQHVLDRARLGDGQVNDLGAGSPGIPAGPVKVLLGSDGDLRFMYAVCLHHLPRASAVELGGGRCVSRTTLDVP